MMKPCPFCGIEQKGGGLTYLDAEIIGNEPAGAYYDRKLPKVASVKCWNCGARGPTGSGGVGEAGRDAALASATVAWNGRY